MCAFTLNFWARYLSRTLNSLSLHLMEVTEMQEAYQQFRTKGIWLFGGRVRGVRFWWGSGCLDVVRSLQLLLFVVPAQEAHWQLQTGRRGQGMMYGPGSPQLKGQTADKNLTYCYTTFCPSLPKAAHKIDFILWRTYDIHGDVEAK